MIKFLTCLVFGSSNIEEFAFKLEPFITYFDPNLVAKLYDAKSQYNFYLKKSILMNAFELSFLIEYFKNIFDGPKPPQFILETQEKIVEELVSIYFATKNK